MLVYCSTEKGGNGTWALKHSLSHVLKVWTLKVGLLKKRKQTKPKIPSYIQVRQVYYCYALVNNHSMLKMLKFIVIPLSSQCTLLLVDHWTILREQLKICVKIYMFLNEIRTWLTGQNSPPIACSSAWYHAGIFPTPRPFEFVIRRSKVPWNWGLCRGPPARPTERLPKNKVLKSVLNKTSKMNFTSLWILSSVSREHILKS